MPNLFLQGKVIEVSTPQFLGFFLKWVKGCEFFLISCARDHIAGLADFNGRYTFEAARSLKTQSKDMESQIENKKIISLLHELMNSVDKLIFVEEEIVKEYAREVRLDISIEANRKKLKRKVKKYRFGDISHGTNAVFPEKVIELTKDSTKFITDVEHIANSLDMEIENIKNQYDNRVGG